VYRAAFDFGGILVNKWHRSASSQAFKLSEIHRTEVSAEMNIQFVVFWVVTSCSDKAGNQLFGGPCCLHQQGEMHWLHLD